MPQDHNSEIPQNLLERLHFVPGRPLNYLPRPAELETLKELILAEQNSSVVIAGKKQVGHSQISLIHFLKLEEADRQPLITNKPDKFLEPVKISDTPTIPKKRLFGQTEETTGSVHMSNSHIQQRYTDLLSILKPLDDNEENLRRLEGQIKGNGVIPFVGAGLSIPFGMPAWNAFLLKMAEKRGMTEQIQQRLDAQKYEEAAEDLLAEYGARAFHDQIEAAFGNHKWTGQSFADKAVSVLPFLAVGPVITTNYDQILEEAFKQSGRPFERVVIGTRPDLIAKALQSGNQFLLKVHGDVDDRTDRILTFTEYQHHYGTTAASPVDLSKPLPAHLKAMMINRPLLFVGCSLNQDRMTTILTHIAHTLPGVAHYAIVAKPNDLQKFRARARQLSDFGIRPIWYPEGRHDLIKLILEYLANRPQPAPQATPPQPAPQPAVVPQATSQIDQGKLLETLTKITEVDFGKLVFLLGAGKDIPGDGEPQKRRAIKLLEWADSRDRLPELVTTLETRILHRPL